MPVQDRITRPIQSNILGTKNKTAPALIILTITYRYSSVLFHTGTEKKGVLENSEFAVCTILIRVHTKRFFFGWSRFGSERTAPAPPVDTLKIGRLLNLMRQYLP